MSIIGANSVVTKDIPRNKVAVGNPARVICTLDEYKSKVVHDFDSSPQFDYSYTLYGGIDKEMKDEMNISIIKNGYVL